MCIFSLKPNHAFRWFKKRKITSTDHKINKSVEISGLPRDHLRLNMRCVIIQDNLSGLPAHGGVRPMRTKTLDVED